MNLRVLRELAIDELEEKFDIDDRKKEVVDHLKFRGSINSDKYLIDNWKGQSYLFLTYYTDSITKRRCDVELKITVDIKEN